jgi:hypothetical protein
MESATQSAITQLAISMQEIVLSLNVLQVVTPMRLEMEFAILSVMSQNANLTGETVF